MSQSSDGARCCLDDVNTYYGHIHALQGIDARRSTRARS